MREDGIGRLLVASLHQGIADILPTRLEFYENWLSAEGLRNGKIGIAPVQAVLSFLRQEGAAYDLIMRRAGRYAAEWNVASMAPFRRTLIRRAPPWLRVRLALGEARRLVRGSYRDSRALSRVRRRTASVDLRASIFCGVREPGLQPLCGFYAAAFSHLMALFDLNTRSEVASCRGLGDRACVLTLDLLDGHPAIEPPMEVV